MPPPAPPTEQALQERYKNEKDKFQAAEQRGAEEFLVHLFQLRCIRDR